MPGIVGMVTTEPSLDGDRAVQDMIASMRHDVSYVSGQHSTVEMGVYAGWVAHEHAADQVYYHQERGLALLLSGELFNIEGTRHSAQSLPASFLEQYETEGENVFPKLNGLFSALLVDGRNNKAFLINDRYGSERLYIHRAENTLYFASEAKALLRVVPKLRQFDEDGVAQFVAYGCTFGRRTLFRGVDLLPGATVLTLRAGECAERQYFDRREWEALPMLSEENFQIEFANTFKRVLPRYFEADCAIGIALTGGLDTRMVMACRPSSAHDLISYTFTGTRGTTRDDRVAAEVAKVCRIEHRLLRLRPDFFRDFSALADETVYITDGTFGVTGTHEIYFNRQARELAPVRLTGLFGSEITRGISTFKPLGMDSSLFDPQFRPRVKGALAERTPAGSHPISFAAFENVPWHLYGSVTANRSQVTLRTPYLDNELVELAFQSPPTLRRSPAAALRLVKENDPQLASVPTDRRIEDKHAGVFRRARRLMTECGFKLDYVRNYGTPNWLVPFDPLIETANSYVKVFDRHKFLHYRRWFGKELHPYIADRLTDALNHPQPFWNERLLARMCDDHARGRGNYLQEINTILTLDAVRRELFERFPAAEQGAYSCR